MPLGIGQARAVKSRGFAVSLCVIFVYYILLSAGQALAEQGSIPAWVGLWLPNVVFGLLGDLPRATGGARARTCSARGSPTSPRSCARR